MAKVPVYGGPQIERQAPNPTRMQTPDVSSGLQSLAKGVGAVGDVTYKVAERDAQTEAWQAQAGILEKFNTWKADAQKNLRGNNAKGYQTQVDEWWTKARDEEFSKLSPLAQQFAAKALSTARLNALESAGGYEAQQVEIGARSSLNDAVAQLRAQAIEAGPQKAAPFMEQIEQQLRSFATARGLDAEDEIRKEKSRTNMAFLASMIAKDDPKGAREYFLANKDGIDPERWDDIEASLDNATEKLRTKTGRDMYGNLRLSLLQGAVPTKSQIEQLRQFSPDHAADLQAGINAWRKAQKAEASGTGVKTDIRALFEARDKILAAASSGGQQPDLLGYIDRIGRSDLEELKKMQEAATKPGAAKRMFTEERTIDTYRPEGLRSTDERWLKLRKEMEDKLILARERKGGDLSDKEMRQELDGFFVEGVVEGMIWDTKKPRWEMTPEERSKAKFADNPAADKFNVGQIYRDKNGNRAKYLGAGKWEPVK